MAAWLRVALVLPLAGAYTVGSGSLRTRSPWRHGTCATAACSPQPHAQMCIAADEDAMLEDDAAFEDAAAEEEEQLPISGARAVGVPLFCLNVRLVLKPERRDEFLECIAANQRGTLTEEPLAVTYQYGEDTGAPNTFHFHERYQGEEGFQQHIGAEHFEAWKAFEASGPFAEPPRIEFFTQACEAKKADEK